MHGNISDPSGKEAWLAADSPRHRLVGRAELVVARRGRRRPAVEAPSCDVPHGPREGELGVQPGCGVEVPAHRHVPPQRRLHTAFAAGLSPQPLAHGLRAEAAHPAPAVGGADAADIGGGTVLRHAAARAPHGLRHVGAAGDDELVLVDTVVQAFREGSPHVLILRLKE
jgi:hypothetical protein